MPSGSKSSVFNALVAQDPEVEAPADPDATCSDIIAIDVLAPVTVPVNAKVSARFMLSDCILESAMSDYPTKNPLKTKFAPIVLSVSDS